MLLREEAGVHPRGVGRVRDDEARPDLLQSRVELGEGGVVGADNLVHLCLEEKGKREVSSRG